MLGKMLEELRAKAPVIHSITNYVTANDCANMLIACGASPIMADEREEAAEITSLCSGLNINMGTISTARIEAMLLAGKRSNELGHPVVLDPVGVGASRLRMDTAAVFLSEIRFAAIRGNMSEIRCLAMGSGAVRGVDASAADRITEKSLYDTAAFAKAFSRKTGSVIVITGAIDVVADEDKAFCISNGDPMMSSVSGTGCQLSAMTAAFIAANPGDHFEAAAAAVCAMGLAGELAKERMGEGDGNASYRGYIIDAVYNMTPQMLEKGARYEVR